MEPQSQTHVKIWRDYSGTRPLSKEEIESAVAQTLELPWMKKLLVFSDQFVVLLEFHSQKYIYVSPWIKNVLGYTPEEFTDIHFVMSTLMTPEEVKATIKISESFISYLSSHPLTATAMLKIRSTRNTWLKKRDGTQIHFLQQGYVLKVNDDVVPLVQIILSTDISAFNNKHEHFHSLRLVESDGSEQILLSGCMENEEGQPSSRELDIFRLVSQGESSEGIARRLAISEETVKTHRKNILEKTHSQNSLDLVRYGYAHGWL